MSYFGTVNLQANGAVVSDANPLPVDDAGGSITVDGPLTDAQLRAAAVSVVPNDFVIASTGFLSGKAAKMVYVLGRRTVFNATSPFQDIAPYLVGGQSALNSVSVATQYYIVSTSANDAPGSAGVSKVRIVYLDTAGSQQVITVTLNGTTKVSLPEGYAGAGTGKGYKAFQWMESAELGAVGASAAAGNIAIFSGAGAAAAEATTVEIILATGNRSLCSRYMVPTGKSGYLMGWTSSAPGSQAMDVRLRADVFADDRTLSEGIFHFQGTSYLAAGYSGNDEDLHFLKCPAGCTIKASCYPAATTGTPRVDVNFHLLVVDN